MKAVRKKMVSRMQEVNDIGAKDAVLDIHQRRKYLAIEEKFVN